MHACKTYLAKQILWEILKGREDSTMIPQSVEEYTFLFPQAVQIDLGLFNLHLQHLHMCHYFAYLVLNLT